MLQTKGHIPGTTGWSSRAWSLLQKVMERLALRQLFCCSRSVPLHKFNAEGASEWGKRAIASKLHGEPPYLTNRICHIESWILNPVSVKDLSALFLSEKGYFLPPRNHSSKSFYWSWSFKPFKTSPKEHLTKNVGFTPTSSSCPLAQHLEHN